MKRNTLMTVTGATIAGAALLLAGSPVFAAGPSDEPAELHSTESASGAVTSVTAATGVPASAVDPALLAQLGAAPGSSFVAEYSNELGSGTVKRFEQRIGDHPVAGSSVAVIGSATGELEQAVGAVASETAGEFPSAAELGAIEDKAVQAAIKHTGASGANGAVTDAVWFAPGLSGLPEGSTVAEPAVQVHVTDAVGSWDVTVSATNPSSVLSSTTNNHELTRVVCDAKRNVAPMTIAALQCGNGKQNVPVRKEGSAASGLADANNVYDFFGETSAFYAKNTNARDLTALVGANYKDGLGTAIRGSVRQCVQGEACPWRNAFWSDDLSAMVYGEGVTTDDITGHELTHGVTSRTNGLAYQNESGAINESMSDVFGELLDVSNGDSDDTAANRWKIGEGSALGVIRDMKNPNAHQQPSTYKGVDWYPTSTNPNSENDYGGVHYNSGVGNKLAQLITDGGSFNGRTVAALGEKKTAQLYWTTQTLLPANATYGTLADVLVQACKANVTNGIAGTTQSNCTAVGNAIAAVKLP